jgi:hypothetical protein
MVQVKRDCYVPTLGALDESVVMSRPEVANCGSRQLAFTTTEMYMIGRIFEFFILTWDKLQSIYTYDSLLF